MYYILDIIIFYYQIYVAHLVTNYNILYIDVFRTKPIFNSTKVAIMHVQLVLQKYYMFLVILLLRLQTALSFRKFRAFYNFKRWILALLIARLPKDVIYVDFQYFEEENTNRKFFNFTEVRIAWPGSYLYFFALSIVTFRSIMTSL